MRYDEHVGELRVSIEASTLEGIFAEAARVVARECGAAHGAAGDWLRVELVAADDATLLVDWMNELIGLSELEGRALDEVRFEELRSGAIRAHVRGPGVSEWTSPLKAATYHGLRLERTGGGWRATVLLDV